MSNRALRVQRRAAQRAAARELRERLHLGGAGEHRGWARCLVPGCADEAPVVVFGPVHLALCPGHKHEYDELYRANAFRRPPAA